MPKLTLVQSDSKKILISFLYSISSAINVLIDDTISLLVEGSTEALASVIVGNPRGHWSQGDFKVGQVTLDISAVTVYLGKRYNLCYVSQNTIQSSLALTWKPEDGAFTEYHEQNNEQEPATSPAMQDYALVSGNIYSDTSSFECPRMSSQTSSSFVVVDEIDSKPQESEELIVVENGTDDFHNQPDDFEGFPDPVNSPSNNESEPWIQSPGTPSKIMFKTEDVEEYTEVPSTSVNKTSPKSDSAADVNLMQSDIPLEMSASVNWDDRPQGEVKLLRSKNRDLNQKLRKLTKIMGNMQNELVVLREKPGHSEETMEKIRHLKAELEQCKQKSDSLEILIAKLKEEKHLLKKKNAQLTIERNTQFERSATLLEELQDKEKENEVLKSENMVLQGKLKRLDDNERKKKRQPRNQEHDQRRAKVDPIEIPVKLTTHKTPVENGHKTEPSRPSDLPLTGGAKLKPAPPPQIIPQERRRPPEGRKTHQPPLDKQPLRQPLRKSSQTKPDSQKRGDPAHASKPLHSDQRASDMIISEQRVGELANSVRGTSSIVCPICQKSLHAREGEYSVQLHVEQCLQSTYNNTEH